MPIPTEWIWGAVYGLAVALGLELAYALVRRRHARRLQVRLLYHLWAIGCGLLTLLSVLQLEERGLLMWRIVTAVTAVLTVWVLFSLVDSLVLQRPWAVDRGPMMPKLARDVIRLLLLVSIVLLATTWLLERGLSAALLSSTIISAVIGLALQDVLKNIFAGIAIEMEGPFKRGDWLLLDGEPVRVIDMSWRSTRVRTKEGVDLWEPNATLSASRIANLGNGRLPVAVTLRIALPYDVSPQRAKRSLRQALAAAPMVLDSPSPAIHLIEYGDHAVIYRLRVWTREPARLGKFRDQVHSRIWYELRRSGIMIPFPVRTVELHDAADEGAARRQQLEDRAYQLISEIDLFRDLEEGQIRQLAAAAHYELYDRGEVLVREGAGSASLFLVIEGGVVVSKSGRSAGAEKGSSDAIQLARLKRGDFFGEMSLLTGEPRSATVTADDGCEVLVLSNEDLAPLFAEDPSLAESLTAALAERQASTSRLLETRTTSKRSETVAAEQVSLLKRVRSFFKLP